MEYRIVCSMFLLLSIFVVGVICTENFSAGGFEVDPLIEQVTDGHDGAETPLLTAEHHFSMFKKRFKKSYGSQEEHDHRFKVFQYNLRQAARHQKLDPSATHGVTQFSDLTPDEFRKMYLGLRKLRLPEDANEAPILPTDSLPEDFDWREKGAVTAVKNSWGENWGENGFYKICRGRNICGVDSMVSTVAAVNTNTV